jgi:hypothetical protein
MVANTKTIATKNNISVRKTPIGRKSATAAVLLAYIFSVCLLKILAEFSEYFLSHHGHYF